MAHRRTRAAGTAALEGRAPRPDPAGPPPNGGFRPWHFFVLASLVAATAAVVLSHGAAPEHLVLLSLTIGAAGAAGLGVFRTVAPLVGGELKAAADGVGTRSRAGLEREKALVLRAIKELEFDRAMGKVSARDFDEMVARLRARAVALMKQLDGPARGYRELIERELLARLGPAPARPGIEAPRAAPVATGARRCPACGTPNDADARFCKQCGARVDPAAASGA